LEIVHRKQSNFSKQSKVRRIKNSLKFSPESFFVHVRRYFSANHQSQTKLFFSFSLATSKPASSVSVSVCLGKSPKVENETVPLPLCSLEADEHVYEIRIRGISKIRTRDFLLRGEWSEAVRTISVCKSGPGEFHPDFTNFTRNL